MTHGGTSCALITDEGTTASVVTYLLPIVGVILGAAILGDRITAQILDGMLIVLIGVAITRRTHEVDTAEPELCRALPKLASGGKPGAAPPAGRPLPEPTLARRSMREQQVKSPARSLRAVHQSALLRPG